VVQFKDLKGRSKEAGLRLKIIKKLKNAPELKIYLTNQQLRFESGENLLKIYYHTLLLKIENEAAVKIRSHWLRYLFRRAYYQMI
jgi:hypothetical protein